MNYLPPYYMDKLNGIVEVFHKFDISNIMELTVNDYFVLLKYIPDCKLVSNIMYNFYHCGFIEISDEEIPMLIENIHMSTRLKNILLRNGIFYLPQLAAYPEELIFRFRNLGKIAMKELKNICSKSNIEIRSIQLVKDSFSYSKFKFNDELYYLLFYYGITTTDDFNSKSTLDLYNICSKKYDMTAEAYTKLHKNGVSLKKGEDVFLFEILELKKAIEIFKKYNIKTLGELLKCSSTKVQEIGITSIESLIKNISNN